MPPDDAKPKTFPAGNARVSLPDGTELKGFGPREVIHWDPGEPSGDRTVVTITGTIAGATAETERTAPRDPWAPVWKGGARIPRKLKKRAQAEERRTLRPVMAWANAAEKMTLALASTSYGPLLAQFAEIGKGTAA